MGIGRYQFNLIFFSVFYETNDAEHEDKGKVISVWIEVRKWKLPQLKTDAKYKGCKVFNAGEPNHFCFRTRSKMEHGISDITARICAIIILFPDLFQISGENKTKNEKGGTEWQFISLINNNM